MGTLRAAWGDVASLWHRPEARIHVRSCRERTVGSGHVDRCSRRDLHLKTHDASPLDPAALIRDVYERAGLALSSPVIQEPESVEYGASTFGVGGRNVIFRVAKTTPTKLGQFVTLWKRNAMTAKIVPFDASDPVDVVVIHSACGGEQGQFIFDQKTMVERGVFSVSGQGGKRALRIYPPWSNPLSREAVKTQQWQQRSFVSLSEAGGVDSARLKELLG